MKMEKQYDLLKTELELIQRQIDKYDQLGMQIKTWAVTLWAASAGWAFQVERKEIVLLGLILVGTFWFFDGLNKTFRQDYKKRRDEVAGVLRVFYASNNFPQNFGTPKFPEHKRSDIVKNAFVLHLALPYAILVFVSVLIYIQF